MKKVALLVLAAISILSCAQSKYTIEQAEISDDPKVLANFIVNNPKHPKTAALKQKLAYIMTKNSNIAVKKSPNPQKEIKPSHTNTTNKETSKSPQSQTADILNHILNGSSNSKSAYIVIKNLSKCSIRVHLKGNKNYYLDILSGSNGRLLVDKGTYHISSKICNANFSSHKNISNDFEMTLNN